MFFKVIIISFLAVASAQHAHHAAANSYNHHISHDYHHAAPVLVKAVAPVHQIAHVSPVVHAPQHGHHASSYASVNNYNHIAHDYHHAAPAVIKVPVATYHAPVIHHVEHVSPVVHHVAPVLHHVAPVAHHVAPVVHHVAPVAVKATPVLLKSTHHEEEHYAPAKYQFKYGVKDTHTHDIKEQEETRDGYAVKGHYSLLQPDGRTRIVHYTADKHTGFQAHVEYSGHAAHPEVQHKAVVVAPIYHH